MSLVVSLHSCTFHPFNVSLYEVVIPPLTSCLCGLDISSRSRVSTNESYVVN